MFSPAVSGAASPAHSPELLPYGAHCASKTQKSESWLHAYDSSEKKSCTSDPQNCDTRPTNDIVKSPSGPWSAAD